MSGTQLRFYTSEKLGAKQSLTPEGFLLCRDVAIARTGTMLYSAGEVPVQPDRDGIIRIHREPNEVFSPMAIASFNGKPVTNDHPPEKVSPQSWKTYSIGVCLDPRRGDGLLFDNDFLYADLLIQDQDAIKDVREGKREVSAGYDAEYEDIAPGEGRQHLIVGNHVALVDRGRCGPKCFIGDTAMSTRRKASMGDTILASSRDRIMRAFKTGDASTLVDELERIGTMLGDVLSGANEGGNFEHESAPIKGYGASTSDFDAGGTHIHIHGGGGADAEDPAGAAAMPAAGGAAAPPVGGAGAGADPSMGGGGEGGMSEVLERLEALERAVAILAQGGEGGEAPGGEAEAPGGEPAAGPDESEDRGIARDARRRVRDEAPSAPDGARVDGAPEEDPVGPKYSGDRRKAAVGDSSGLKGPWQEMISRAELLAPGIRYPTMDARAGAKTTFDAMCGFRRRVLGEAMKEEDSKQAVLRLSGSRPDLRQMSCDAVSILFNGASDAMRKSNGQGNSFVNDGVNYATLGNVGMQAAVQSMNEKNRKFYKVGGA